MRWRVNAPELFNWSVTWTVVYLRLQGAIDDSDNTTAGPKNANKTEQDMMGNSSMAIQVIRAVQAVSTLQVV